MPPPKYLKQRNGVWYVQMRVPAQLRDQLGAMLMRSLKTRDETEALKKRHSVVAEFQEMIDRAAKAPPPPTRLEALLERACRLYEQHGGRPQDTDDLNTDHVSIEAEVDSVIASYPVDFAGDPKVPAADLEMLQRITATAAGMGDQFLDTLAGRWLDGEAGRGTMKASTVSEKRTHIGRLIEFLGKSATPEVLTRKAAVDYVEKVLNPMRVTLDRKRFFLQTCTQFCRWLRVRSMISENPFDEVGILLRAEKVDTVQRRAWRPSELSGFLDSVPVLGDIWKLTVLMAYTGARPQELCMVRREDVTEDAISIPASKTTAGLRTIPIHPVIRPLVAYLAQTSTDGYLIAGLKPTGVDNNRYTLLGKRVATALNNYTTDASIPLYALRHTVVTQMSDADHPRKVIEAVVGHKDGSVLEEHYVKSKKLDKMLQALESVTYGEDLDARIRALS